MANDRAAVNFGQRRRLLVDLEDIGQAYWDAQCAGIGGQRLKAVMRRRAAVWLWSRLTGGDFRFAPWFLQENGARKRAAYREFERRTLPRIEPKLLAYARDHLEACPVPRKAGLLDDAAAG